MDKIKEFEEVCKPVVDYLINNHNPHCKVIITDTNAILVEDKIGIPFMEDLQCK